MRVRGLAAYVRTIPRIMRSSRHAKKAPPVPAREQMYGGLRLKLKFFPFWSSEDGAPRVDNPQRGPFRHRE